MKLMQFRLGWTLLAALMLPVAWGQTYDIKTLAGKVASVNGTAGLQTRFSAFIEEESVDNGVPSAPPITPVIVLSSPLDGSSILPPVLTVNQDTAAGTYQNTMLDDSYCAADYVLRLTPILYFVDTTTDPNNPTLFAAV